LTSSIPPPLVLSSINTSVPTPATPTTPSAAKRIFRMALSTTQLMYEKTKLQRRVEDLEKEKKELQDQVSDTKDEMKIQGDTYEEQLTSWKNKEKLWQKQIEENDAKALESEMKSEEMEAKLKEQLSFRKQIEDLEKEREREHNIQLNQLRDEKYDLELKIAAKKQAEGQMTSEQVKSVLQLAHDHRKQHLSVVEEALEEANRKLKIVADKDDRIKTLQDRLTAAENLCKKLLTEGLKRLKEQQEKKRQEDLQERMNGMNLTSRMQRSRSLRGQSLAQQTAAAMAMAQQSGSQSIPTLYSSQSTTSESSQDKKVKRMSSMYMPIAHRKMSHGGHGSHSLLPFAASPHRVENFKVNDPDSIENFF